MSRKLRLKCPACQTLIETTVDDELRVTLQCAACHKQFTAKVPPRNGDNNQGTVPAQPVVAAQPVSAQPVTARPAAARPVAARPVAARPVAAQPVQPTYAPPPAPLNDPLFDATNNFNFPVTSAYQPVRKRKPINLRPILKIVGSVLGLLLAIGLGLYAWNWAANTDWSTFSVVPDSHERLADEYFAFSERITKENAQMQTNPDYEKIKSLLEESCQLSETMLVRAVRLGKVPLDKKAAFEVRQDAVNKKVREIMEAKMAELKAAGKPPINVDKERMLKLLELPALRDGQAFAFALSGYMGQSHFDLPPPANDSEKIYYEEADLVHTYLKQLTLVRSTAQSKRAAVKIEALADKMMDLATRRSKLPANRFERVPREYATKDKGFGAAQKALVLRIRRDANPDEKLKDAVANFNDARDLLVEAAGGMSDDLLKRNFAEYRKIRAESTKSTPGDLFYDDFPSDPISRDMVVKPARESQPDPVRESPKTEPKPQTAPRPDTVASNNPVNTQPNADSAGTSDGRTDTKPEVKPSTMPSSSSLAESMRDPGWGMRPPNFGPRFSESAPPTGGQTMVAPTPGFNGPPPSILPSMPQSGAPAMSTAESVKIILSKSSRDGNELVQSLAKSLESQNYTMSGSNGKITIQIRYVGDLDRVVQLIDFGKVTLIDSPERTIHVSGE